MVSPNPACLIHSLVQLKDGGVAALSVTFNQLQPYIYQILYPPSINILIIPVSVILLPFWDTAYMPFEFGINPNKIPQLGKKSPKLGKYRPFFDWEAACMRL